MIRNRLLFPVISLMLSLTTFAAESATTLPNIVFILADDMSWYGTETPMQHGFPASAGKTRRTPSINTLAGQGMTFSRAFAPAGMCAPARCSFQTGMTTARTRFSGNGNFGVVSREVTYDNRRNKGRLMLEPSPLGNLDASQDTIAEYLKPLGYATAHVGKWHIYGGGPGKHGYDVHDGETSNEEGNSDDPRDPKRIFSMTAKAIGFIEKQTKANKPFFVQVSHYAEHNAVQYLPETLERCLEDEDIRNIEPKSLRTRVAQRTAMVEDMDTSIGTLLKKLDELGIRDNTYVIFTSDNGHHRDTGETKILRGSKWWLWEGGIRVPMIVSGPGIKPGSWCNDNVVGYDLLPTFVEIGGGSVNKLESVDGESVLSLLHGKSDAKWAKRNLFFHYPHHRNSALHSSVIQGDHKFFRFYERPSSGYLYNLNDNIGETENLAKTLPKVAARLAKAMDQHFTSVEACMPKPNPDADPKYVPFDPDAPQQDHHTTISAPAKDKDKPKRPEKQRQREQRKAQRSSQARQQPNVIFFAVDDMCDWVGPLGYKQAITPNMDRLAQRGVVFTNAHCPGTYCGPSRAAIFTGRFASTTGCYGTEVYFHDHPELRPMQVSFQNGGYATFGAGKLFHHPAGYIDMRGWSEFFLRNDTAKKEGWPLDSWGEGTPIPQPFPNSIYNRGRQIKGGLFLEWGKVPNDKEEEMADTIRVNWACDVLRKKHDQPFFLAVGIYAPHFPNYAPAKYFDLYDPEKIKAPPYKDDDLEDLPPKIMRNKTNRKRLHHERLVKLDAVEDAIHGYLASVSYADAMLGRVLSALRDSPHAKNTIVVLWSDHGYHHGEKGDWGKHTLWERTSNVPFIWTGPGVARGETVDTTVSLIDMYPTFVEMCGLPAVKGLEGKSLASTLRQPSTATDRDVYLPYLDPGGYAIINKQWRYIHYSDDTEELYDVRKDPNEWHNLAEDEKYAKVKQKLRASAPKKFAPKGTPKNRLRLVVEGESYHWKAK